MELNFIIMGFLPFDIIYHDFLWTLSFFFTFLSQQLYCLSQKQKLFCLGLASSAQPETMQKTLRCIVAPPKYPPLLNREKRKANVSRSHLGHWPSCLSDALPAKDTRFAASSPQRPVLKPDVSVLWWRRVAALVRRQGDNNLLARYCYYNSSSSRSQMVQLTCWTTLVGLVRQDRVDFFPCGCKNCR